MALKKLVTDLTQGLEAYPNHNTLADTGGFNYGGSTSVFDTKLFQQRTLSYKKPLSRQDNPEPLIPQILPGVNQEPGNSILYLDDSPDGFLRGGVINTIKRAAYDNIRMNRFFKTGEGISFIEVQKALQKTNPIIQEGGGNINNTIEDVINMGTGVNFTSANTNRTFNEGNLIKQITEGGYTGVYYNRAGSNPTIQSEDQNKYFETHKPGRKFDANKMGDFNKQGGLKSGNRLVSLGKKLDVGLRTGVNGNHGINFAINGQESLMHQAVGFDVGDLMDTWDSLKAGFNSFMSNPLESLSQPGPFSPNQEIGFKPGENVIYQYSGGPGSTYGVGDTILYRYERTSGDYDHQGHPLSIEKYNQHKHTTIIGNELIFFNKDGSLNSGIALNYLADTVNDNLFAGNNILGSGGLLFDDSFNFNSPSNILTGLANQVFGENTVNFVTDLFNGGGVGNPTQGPITIGSYLINDIQLIDGSTRKDPIINKSINGLPTSGFIEGYSSPTGKGFGNKPDDIALSIKHGLSDSLPLGVGKVLSPYATISKDGLVDSRYRPKISEFSKNSGKYLGTNNYSKHYNNKIPTSEGVEGNYTRESRIGTGNPGLGYYSAKAGVDQINALDIHTVTDGTFNKPEYRDMIRFRIEAVQTDKPQSSDVMVFRAFLDNFGDNFTANWNSFKYNGRGEDFFTYGGFKRTFSFNFKIAAQSRHEMMPLYRKLNYLVSNLTPDYSKSGRMRAPYIKLCLGSYMDRTPGFMTSVNIKWQKDYPFEIALDTPEGGADSKMHVLPHVLDVSCNFTPIHDFVPRKSVEESPFIIPGSKSETHYSGTDRKWLSGNNSKWVPDEATTSKVSEDNTPLTGVDNTATSDTNLVNKTSDDIKEQGESNSNNQQATTLLKSAADKIISDVTIPLDKTGFMTRNQSIDLDGDGNFDVTLTIFISYNSEGKLTREDIDVTINDISGKDPVYDALAITEYVWNKMVH